MKTTSVVRDWWQQFLASTKSRMSLVTINISEIFLALMVLLAAQSVAEFITYRIFLCRASKSEKWIYYCCGKVNYAEKYLIIMYIQLKNRYIHIYIWYKCVFEVKQSWSGAGLLWHHRLIPCSHNFLLSLQKEQICVFKAALPLPFN